MSDNEFYRAVPYDSLDPHADVTREERKERDARGDKHGPKRDPAQREFDFVEESYLYLHGFTQHAIAAKLSETRPYHISPEMVGNDLRKIQKRWREAYLLNMDEAKSKELARIDELERAYWDGWERSKRNKAITNTEAIEDKSTGKIEGKTTQTWNRKRATKKDEERDGDVDFLRGVEWCIAQRCKIFGLNAAQEIKVTDWRKEAESMGISDAGEMFNDLVGKYVRAASGRSNGGDESRSPESSE